MSTIGFRLKEERNRLGLNQTDFASLAGHSRGAQACYERDEKIPGGAYLQKLAEHGCDVLYILTGNRTPQPQVTISNEEQILIEHYRAMSEESRLNMQAVGSAFAQSVPDKRIKNS
ncbi:helix-turn-helix domain-containing protein [Xenorhabdus bovienii]|uniref:Transcriptional regulator, XRE family n=1 Tax=Xenorhabdus bovienii str. Intermedium TaxID=1379677 RepID=A0A077QC61_XENBV|nr:helix-turn-helix domain-containing protein [Xenorhabdus bovienii]MDE9455745.1 helix-turn-helix domain-containing protein [Xenorhabdus bovienii]MDE9459312.1 helix-turn-helix domain-containing protein [Xenorhabdus bovienii]MDE9483506.1 helix-turn-helix domain-containing protein [Xenorhabdus bovienii]MDE9515504.1 helix-turn-helix domain-containing protein [Xenorhabdus bovienii]MDE9553256.1 helix-turn-helix domain-containing protein [Xenorhabdus bovienii]